MQALQQREAEYQHTQAECQRLQDTLTAMQHQAEQAVQQQQTLQDQLETRNSAVAGAERDRQEVQRKCVGLQRHLGKRRAAMQACLTLLQAAGHG